jgi:hypothetical protein
VSRGLFRRTAYSGKEILERDYEPQIGEKAADRGEVKRITV